MTAEKIKLLLHTVRYLKPTQVTYRVVRKFKKERPEPGPPPPLRTSNGQVVAWPERAASMLSPTRFRFLNVELERANPGDWLEGGPEKLWLLNLHYFDDLNAEGADERTKWHDALVKRWIAENPPATGIGWQAYPASLRIANWVKWHLRGHELSPLAIESLAVQARYLVRTIEWETMGNHVFANGKGLFFAGLFFGGEEGDRWLSLGLKLLKQELEEEILADGGHYERSPMYHSIVLEDVLDLINLRRAYPDAIPAEYRAFADGWSDLAQRMRVWLNVMLHPDGRISFFNDAAFGIAIEPPGLHAYAERLGLAPVAQAKEGMTHLKESGFVRVQFGNTVGLFDVGEIGPSYIPGHSHADTLTFELSVRGKRLVVNSGTSVYKQFPARQQQRSTAAHNTVVVDGQDSSEVWGAFRVARRAYPLDVQVKQEGDAWVVKAAHDGYRRLPGRVTHRRTWRFDPNGIDIVDQLEGTPNEAVGYLHFAPEATVEGGTVRRGPVTATYEAAGADAQVADGTYHPEYGITVPNKQLRLRFAGAAATLRLQWKDQEGR
ncbi:alginate lyase family protein [bacterium]|nr:MAG: alginate lyase family protein [bacterium]